MGKIKTLLLLLLILKSVGVHGQVSDKHNSKYARFYRAEDLFEKHKYSASKKEFEIFISKNPDENHPYTIKAKYYYALNSLRLYHPDAELLLLNFLADYPETIYREHIYFELGKHNYRKRKFEETIAWFNKMEKHDLSEEEKSEFYFKLGYANFREDNLKPARDAFYEVINKESKYKDPALYYYSHIAYTEKSYQTALEGFLKLVENPNFKTTVPYYIAQIYYLQGKYDKVTQYAPNLAEKKDNKQSLGMSHLIGDAFYKVGKYDEAVPFLEEYNRKSATTRDEDYQLGFAYFKSGDNANAIRLFDKVTKEKDKLAQTALYHIGEAYLKMDNNLYARNAFELASNMSFDPEIEEDALYNYAVLSYKLDFNPYDEAVEAMNLYLTKYPDSKRTQDIYQYLINVYTTMKNYKSAIQSIDKLAEKDFKMKSAYQMMAYNYGVELYENGKLPEALAAFKLVKRYPIDPKLNALSLYWVAESYYRLGEFVNTVNSYKMFLEEPGSYSLIQHNDAYYNIAYAYYKQEDYESAIQYFRTFTQDESETHKEKITDAYLRIGDSYYKQQLDEQAIIYYQKAINTKGGQIDYAKYQIALSHGYKHNYELKATTMLDIVNNHPTSVFVVPALYEVAESYRQLENDNKANQYYNQLIIDYPNHKMVQDAVFQIGMIHFRNHEFSQAEKQFLRILNEFNDGAKKKEALARLKDVYTSLNQPEKYIALMEEQGGNFDEGAKDTLYFENAYDLYQDSSWVKSIKAFETYLNTFAKPNYNLEALYFKGTAHLKIEDNTNAHAEYSKLLALSQNRFTEKAAAFSSQYEYDLGNYDNAIIYYEKLLSAAIYPQNKLVANIGLMRCHTYNENFAFAKPYAEKVLIDEQALDYAKTEAHYVIGKAYMVNNDFDNAKINFEEVAANSNGAIGAESQFNIALIYHLQEDYSTSESEVRKLMKNHAGYDYWVAKALILQAKNSMGGEDYVQAEYTLNSVLNGYNIEDDGILDEANEVMQVLQNLKNKDKDIIEDTENIIEINEGGNNE